MSRYEGKYLALLFVIAVSATGEEARRFGERESAPPREAALPADAGPANAATPLPSQPPLGLVPEAQDAAPRRRYVAPAGSEDAVPIVRRNGDPDRGLPPATGLEPSRTPAPIGGIPENAAVMIGEQPTAAPLPRGLATEAQDLPPPPAAPTTPLPRDLSDLHLERWLKPQGQPPSVTTAAVTQSPSPAATVAATLSPSPAATGVPPLETGATYQAPLSGSY